MRRISFQIFPDLSEQEIQDKSRSDGLAKTLLLVQLLHFCASCTARIAQQLPLSLLEFFTLAHALCTVTTCIVWWRKPFGVLEPTLITGERADELVAYMLFTSRLRKDYLAGLVQYTCDSESSYVKVVIALTERNIFGNLDQFPCKVRPGTLFFVEGYRFEVLDKEPDPQAPTILGRPTPPWYASRCGSDNAVVVGLEDMHRWTLAARGLRRYGDNRLCHEDALISRHGGLQKSVFTHGEAWWWPAVPIAIATAYGAVHLAAWDMPFPTPAERMLWRYSTAALLVVGTMFFQYSALARRQSWVSEWIFYVGALIRPLASTYLLFESIRQLLFLPDITYLLPNFSLYLPHVS